MKRRPPERESKKKKTKFIEPTRNNATLNVIAVEPSGTKPGKPVPGKTAEDWNERKAVGRFTRPQHDTSSSSSSSSSESDSIDSEDLGPEHGHRYPQDNPAECAPDLEYPPPATSLLPQTLIPFSLQWILNHRDAARNELEPEKFIVCYGKRGTGKTWAMRAILWMMQPYIPQCIVVSNTWYNGFWQQYVPSKAVWKTFDPARLMDWIFERQRYIDKWNKDPVRQATENPYIALVFEDCISSNNIQHAEAMRYLSMNGRHLKCLVLLSTQHSKGVGPALRANTDYAFIFFQDTKYNKESLLEDYLSTAEGNYRKQDLITWLDAHTQIDEKRGIRSVLVVDNMRQTTQLDRKLYSYTFSDPGPFKFGSREWRIKLGDV